MAKRKRSGRKLSSNNKKSSSPTPSSNAPSPIPPPSTTATTTSNETDNDNIINTDIKNNTDINDTTTTITNTNNDNNNNNNLPPKDHPLILTSNKRNGVYECDYCHNDISQVPRICCAICVEFDICLECFTQINVDMKHSRGSSSSKSHNNNFIMDEQQRQHDSSHGYRVSDSTRYFLFPSLRGVDVIKDDGISTSAVVAAGTTTTTSLEDKDEKDIDSPNPKRVKLDNNTQQDHIEEKNKQNSSMDVDVVEKNNELIQDKDTNINDESMVDEKKESNDVSSEFAEENITKNEGKISNTKQSKSSEEVYALCDDIRYMWTAEEDLRLLDAITTFGLGNWADISEEIGTNKTAKRCMERYIDDFLGRYGHIVPEYTLVQSDTKKSDINMNVATVTDRTDGKDTSKQMKFLLNNREYTIAKTSTLPGFDKVWPDPYLPPLPNIKCGDDVGRDSSKLAEQTYFKALTSASNDEEVDAIKKEWAPMLNKPGGPTVLPPHPEDVKKLQGADLAGFMPRRGDFDIEWDHDADKLLEDMEFSPSDTPEDREIKIKVIEIYNTRLDEREKRKQFLKDYDLLDYRKKQRKDRQLPADERDLVNRMRLFARFHSAEEHQKLIDNILKAKRLRKEIARIQMYQRMGFNSLLDVERFELDMNRKESHRLACRLKEKEEDENQAAIEMTAGSATFSQDEETYNRQYNPDRKIRRSLTRSQDEDDIADENTNTCHSEATKENKSPQNDKVETSPKMDTDDKMPNENAVIEDTSAPTTDLVKDSDESDVFDVKKCEGYALLSSKEIGLCQRLRIKPKDYLLVKKTLIQESLTKGILDDTMISTKRTIVKIDIKTQGDILEFILQSGWIPAMDGNN